MEVGGGELLLHFETTHPGQIHVEHETAGHFVPEPVEELPRGRERLDPEVRRVDQARSEEHTSELQSLAYLVCRLLLEKKKKTDKTSTYMCTAKEDGDHTSTLA